MIVEHKLGSFSDGGSLCLPVFLNRHVGYRRRPKLPNSCWSRQSSVYGTAPIYAYSHHHAQFAWLKYQMFSLSPGRNEFYCVVFWETAQREGERTQVVIRCWLFKCDTAKSGWYRSLCYAANKWLRCFCIDCNCSKMLQVVKLWPIPLPSPLSSVSLLKSILC